MVTSSVTSERALRQRGALVAAAICVAWVVGGGIGWALLLQINSAFAALPALVAIGGAAALPGSTFLGWRYAPRAVETRDAFLPMTMWVVLISDLLVVITLPVNSSIAALSNFFGSDPAPLGADIVVGIAELAVGAIAVYVLGLLIFGLPSLLLAVPSAWYWGQVMRRTSRQ